MILTSVTIIAIQILFFLILYLIKGNRVFLVINVFLAVSGFFAILNYITEFFPLKVAASIYHILASEISGNWLRGHFYNFLFYFTKHEFYVTITAVPFYYLFGPSLLFLKVANLMYSTFTIYNVYRTALLWFHSSKAALWVSMSFIMSPYLIFTLGSEVRDPVVVFFLSEMLYLATVMIRKRSLRNAPLFLLLMAGTYILREELGCVIIIATGVLVVLRVGRVKTVFTSLRVMIHMILFVCLVISSSLVLFLAIKSPALTGIGEEMSLEMMDKRRDSESSSSVYLEDVNYSSPSAVIKNLPLAVLYFLFSPLPWQVNNVKLLFGMIDGLYLFFIFMLSIPGFRKMYRDDRLLFYGVFLFLAGGILGSAIIQANVGAAMRHRMQFSFIFFIMAGYQFQRWPLRIFPKRHGVIPAPVSQAT